MLDCLEYTSGLAFLTSFLELLRERGPFNVLPDNKESSESLRGNLAAAEACSAWALNLNYTG